MKKCKTHIGLKRHLNQFRLKQLSVGFVPTMGALHQGHLSLVKVAKEQNDIVVVSIFVNPKQFDNAEDLKKYPNTISSDLRMLKQIGCDIVFIPGIEDIYPDENPKLDFDLGQLGKIMEGKFRPGHFDGVALVVKRLFDLVQPNKAYFGEKDYQQFLVIKKLVKHFNLNIDIIPCPIIREEDGLAMSSRNTRLSKEERNHASFIHQQLSLAQTIAKSELLANIKEIIIKNFDEHLAFSLEYFEIVDIEKFEIVNEWTEAKKYRALVVAYLGNVRLIDNTSINL